MIPSRLVRDIDAKNIMPLVFAAGNGNLDCGGASSILCINSNEGGITAAALDRQGIPQNYSSRGPGQCSIFHPFIGAPTYGVLPWGDGYLDFGPLGAGTSSTAPQVSGALAVLKAAYPKANNTVLRVALAAGAQKSPPPYGLLPFNTGTGFGLLRVDRALGMVPIAQFHPLYFPFALRAAKPPWAGLAVFADMVKPSGLLKG